jgi:hypothetical protein
MPDAVSDVRPTENDDELLWEDVLELEASVRSARRTAKESRRHLWAVYASTIASSLGLAMSILLTAFDKFPLGHNHDDDNWLALATIVLAAGTLCLAFCTYAAYRDAVRLRYLIQDADGVLHRAKTALGDDDVEKTPFLASREAT